MTRAHNQSLRSHSHIVIIATTIIIISIILKLILAIHLFTCRQFSPFFEVLRLLCICHECVLSVAFASSPELNGLENDRRLFCWCVCVCFFVDACSNDALYLRLRRSTFTHKTREKFRKSLKWHRHSHAKSKG